MFKLICIMFIFLSLPLKAEINLFDKYKNIENFKKTNKEISDIINKDLTSFEFKNLSKKEKISLIRLMIDISFKNKNTNQIKKLSEEGLNISIEDLDIAYFNYYKAYSINGSNDRKVVQESVDILIKVFDFLKDNNTEEAKKIKFDSAFLIADTYALYSNPTGAMNYYKKAENYIDTDLNILDVKNSKVYLYNSLNLYDLAIKEMDEISKLLEVIKLEEDKILYYKESIYQFYIYIYERMEKYNSAHEYAEKYMDLVKNSKNYDDIIKSYYLIATTYSRLENFSKAEEYYAKAEELIQKYEYKKDYLSALVNYSKIAYYKHKKDYDNALIYLDKFKEEAGVTSIALDYSYVYKQKRDFKKAYEYYEIYIKSLDKKIKEEELEHYIINNQKQRSDYLNNQQKRLKEENKGKDKEIENLKHQNKILSVNSLLIKVIIFFALISLFAYMYLYKKYRHLSLTDGLTQLNNKRYLNRNIKKYSNIIIFDIDYFKKINDTYGHLAGDYVLKETAKIAKEIIGNKGKVCRYGGEEFVILLNKKIDAKLLSEIIRDTIEKNVFKFEDLEIKFTVSIGISDNLEKADENLYKAKNSGRNKVIY